jgi:hypothetical protein
MNVDQQYVTWNQPWVGWGRSAPVDVGGDVEERR